MRKLGASLHDEVMVIAVPATKCGHSLEALADEPVPESVGFCTEEAVLTCVPCASERILDGDRQRQAQKSDLFGVLYGMNTSNVLKHIKPAKAGTYVPGTGSYTFTTQRLPQRGFRQLRRALAKALL
jgi:hypothetical protein